VARQTFAICDAYVIDDVIDAKGLNEAIGA
jgi:hypothetical protein